MLEATADAANQVPGSGALMKVCGTGGDTLHHLAGEALRMKDLAQAEKRAEEHAKRRSELCARLDVNQDNEREAPWLTHYARPPTASLM
jgi:hypothetical protein